MGKSSEEDAQKAAAKAAKATACACGLCCALCIGIPLLCIVIIVIVIVVLVNSAASDANDIISSMDAASCADQGKACTDGLDCSGWALCVEGKCSTSGC